MTQPDEIEALAAAILADLSRVQDLILEELARVAEEVGSLTAPGRRRRLQAADAAINEILDSADTVAAAQVVAATQAAYETGAWVTAILSNTGAAFTPLDVDSITAIAQDTMSDLLRATRHVRVEVKDLLRELVRDSVRVKTVTGQTAVEAARELLRRATEAGITGVVYSNGARVPMTVYAEMVLRTKTAEAYQKGGFAQGERLGIDQWQIMDGPGCGLTGHGVGEDADGMIVDLATARQHPLAHPNCRRSTSPRPDLAAPDPMGDPQAIWADAVRRQTSGQQPLTPSSTPHVTPGIDTAAGVLPDTPAARRHAATLRRHQA